MVTSLNSSYPSSLPALFTPAAQPLTVAQFRQFPSCEHYTDLEAAAILHHLTTLAHLLHDHLHQPAPDYANG